MNDGSEHSKKGISSDWKIEYECLNSITYKYNSYTILRQLNHTILKYIILILYLTRNISDGM